MKLTVNKYLNARIGEASTEAACQFYRSPGDSIEVTAVLVGTRLDGNSIWYKNKADDCFYWSGGVEEIDFNYDALNPDLLNEKDRMALLAEAKDYYWEYYSARLANLSGIRIGDKYIDANATAHDDTLVFQVIEKIADVPGNELIPTVLHYRGFAIMTDVVQADIADAQLARPGDSLSRINSLNDWGSVGVKVFRTEDDETDHFLLTNYHVACNDLLRQNKFSYNLFTDGDIDHRQILVAQNFSDLKNETAIGGMSEGVLNVLYDVSLSLLNSDDLATNTVSPQVSIKTPLDIFNDKTFKDAAVKMYGARSGEQSSTVVSVNSSQVFKYNNGAIRKKIINLIELERCSNPGDSGSPVLIGNAIIGILVGADNKSTYIIPIKRILDFLNIKIA